MRHLLMLNYEYPPLGGGAGNATRFLLTELASFSDIAVDLITSSADAKKIEPLTKRISIHYLNIGKRGQRLQYQTSVDLLKYSWQAYHYVKKLLRAKRYNFCHAFFAVPCGYLSWRLKLPYLLSLRGTDVPGHNPKFQVIYKLIGRQINQTLRHAAIVVANSRDLADEAARTCRRTYQVIPNGVDLNFFHPTEKTNGVFRVLYAGRLHAVKNLNQLIKGFAEFTTTQPAEKLELTIAGDGPERARLQKLAATLPKGELVRFTGQLSTTELRSEYQRCSVFALVSESEGMSNTLLEAMACGTPILSSDTGGSRQLISQDNGLILTEVSQASIGRALKYFFDRRDQLANSGRSSRRVAEQYSWKRTAEEYYRLYQQMYELA